MELQNRAHPRVSEASDARLARTQALSGLVFSTFLVLHLATTASMVLGWARYDAVLRAMRGIYQYPWVEIIGIIGSLLVHITAGLRRRRLRRTQQAATARMRPQSLRARLHRYSGYFLLVFVFGHIAATRLPTLVYGVEVNFAFLSFGMVHYPNYFNPYYTLLFTAGGLHLIHGITTALAVLGVRVPTNLLRSTSRPFWIATTAIAGLAICCVLALGGTLYELDRTRFPALDRIARQVLPEHMHP